MFFTWGTKCVVDGDESKLIIKIKYLVPFCQLEQLTCSDLGKPHIKIVTTDIFINIVYDLITCIIHM